ncbi:hypothetical protein RRG08_043511 [Elysia crispata]|uniref:Uncharacterized protein n=1 Tax=Elysia crispata TaxID=231223 RepID=A0AAE0YFD0_9GAST|nr:hypothetical protein RRG08_043511 [Elysia crispata]
MEEMVESKKGSHLMWLAHCMHSRLGLLRSHTNHKSQCGQDDTTSQTIVHPCLYDIPYYGSLVRPAGLPARRLQRPASSLNTGRRGQCSQRRAATLTADRDRSSASTSRRTSHHSGRIPTDKSRPGGAHLTDFPNPGKCVETPELPDNVGTGYYDQVKGVKICVSVGGRDEEEIFSGKKLAIPQRSRTTHTVYSSLNNKKHALCAQQFTPLTLVLTLRTARPESDVMGGVDITETDYCQISLKGVSRLKALRSVLVLGWLSRPLQEGGKDEFSMLSREGGKDEFSMLSRRVEKDEFSMRRVEKR